MQIIKGIAIAAAQLIEQYLLHSDELTKEQETVTMR